MNEEQAREAVRLLLAANDALTEYREYTEKIGHARMPMSDLAVVTDFESKAEDNELTVEVSDGLVQMLLAGASVQIDSSGYVWQGFSDDAIDMIERLGLLVTD